MKNYIRTFYIIAYLCESLFRFYYYLKALSIYILVYVYIMKYVRFSNYCTFPKMT